MGAYENPKFFNAPNYMAGTQAFLTTFKQGFEQEFQKGQDLIEDRKAYEDGIYEKGEELKQELDAAVSNSQMTKQQVQDALRSFYDEALSVDMPTKKGLGGLFAKPTERRLGKLDLIEAQNSFTDAVTGINTAFNYAYDPEIDIMENEDRGHPQFKKKKAIYDAIKNASANPNFSYADGKFDGSLEVVIDGKKQKFTTGEIQAIFNASGKEQRDIIDTKHNEMLEGISTQVTTAINNDLEYLKYKAGDENKLIVGKRIAERIVNERLGIMGEPSQYSKTTLSFLNDEYNNHANINENQKINIVKKSLTFLPMNVSKKLSTDEIARIANEPMDISAATYAKRYDITPEEAIQLRQQILQGKTEVVKVSYMQDLADKGLVNKAYVAPTKQERGATQGEINLQASNNKSQTDLNKVTNVINRIPSNLVGADYNQGDNNVPMLDFNTIRRSDASGNFVTKEVVGQTFDPITNTLSLKYEQDTKTADVPSGEKNPDGSDIFERQSVVNYDTEDYKIHTIAGLRKLYEDVLMDATDLDKKTRATYFENNILKTLNSQWMNNESYLDKFDRETHDRMINAYGGFEAAKKLDIFNSRPWFQNIMREKRLKK